MTGETLKYAVEKTLIPTEFVDLLVRSGLAERRPVDDAERISAMLEHTNLIVTARDGDLLVGVSRSVTDFAFCCYLSDLAVDAAYQKRGIGQELIRRTRAALHPEATLLLLAAPKAEAYYPHIGFEKLENAWRQVPGS